MDATGDEDSDWEYEYDDNETEVRSRDTASEHSLMLPRTSI